MTTWVVWVSRHGAAVSAVVVRAATIAEGVALVKAEVADSTGVSRVLEVKDHSAFTVVAL